MLHGTSRRCDTVLAVLSYQQALECLLRIVQPLAAERLLLTAAAGRTLAAAVVAPHPMPPFDQSLMDGYAVRSSDTRIATANRPVLLPLVYTLTAGESLRSPLAPRQAIRIMTGAPLPAGADAVIKLEDGEVQGQNLVIRQPLPGGVYIQRRGAEIRRHTVVVRAGERLTPQRTGLALALGLERVEVTRRPRIAFVAPGDELLPPGAPLQPGKKWCSNLYALAMRAQELGATSVDLGIVPDTLEALTSSLQQGLASDAVVLLGASGRGDHDFAGRAMATIGAEMLLQGVAMNPGRSIAVARHRHTLFFGLPGSPWAAFIGFEVFIRPALRAMLGQPSPPPIAAVLTTTVQVRRGVTHFLPARLRQSADGWEATPLSDLLSIAQLESHPIGLIPVLPHRRQLSRGARVRVHLL
ncbi:MAG: gephyrin-like molybdotransferase Glp [Candidatus Tectomicrobia bacterium]